ncbi:enoyl-CoA hydratase-related protein [Acuticoccus sp. M5D2P5]|uniref:enoyl-CoA hydratase/isomerase family protein n=1 Tax=Acuticoccus kalidii TaxID=2910977 RepID=UPI001F3F2037|nr:enoyl-CoA hydratase-related protein [Acuticoccus kalidii]MCF3935214.1 enoyl-CoA hydratase-related protein [Acuticoccus kalidii]
MSDPVLVDVKDGIATVTLNNPPLNIVTLPMTAMLEETLDRLAADPDVHVMILTGAGDRGFCAGSDIKEFPDMQDPGVILERKLIRENRVYSKVDDFPKPTICAIKGLAMGGGLELAVCCDLLVVDEDVRLSLPEIKLGWFPGSGGPVRVTRRIGEGRAKEMMFIGEPINATTALAWGLVNRVVPKDRVIAEAELLAREIASRSNPALQCCKAAIDMSFDMTEDEAIEGALKLSDKVFRTADSREGVRAFLAKDTPRFTHS